MILEIEIKILEINKEEMIKKLTDLGAKKLAEENQKSYFFDFPDCRLKNEKRSVRLRSFGKKKFITSKKAISANKSKIEEEIEVDVSSIEETEKLFLAIGLEKKDSVECKRTKYKTDDALFEIDEYPNVPCFMEIEAATEEIVHNWVEKLGVEKTKLRAWGGRELFDYYGLDIY